MNKTVSIIGAGPSGIAAAIQLGRYNIKTIIFEKNIIGGLLNNANFVENYPGFYKGINGRKLCLLFKEHLKISGAEVIMHEVTEVKYEKSKFIIRYGKNEVHSDYFIYAAGTKPVKYKDIKLNANYSENIFYELTEAESKFSSGKKCRIGIIGGGDAAFDYALSLGKNHDVIIMNRSSKIKGLLVLKKMIDKTKSIEYKDNFKITGIENKEDGLIIVSNNNEYFFNYLIFAVGRKPETELIENEKWYKSGNIRNLFITGDVKNGFHRQAAIAAGQGIDAAMKIFDSIKENYEYSKKD